MLLRSAFVLAVVGYGGLLWHHCLDWPAAVFYGALLLAVAFEAAALEAILEVVARNGER